MSGHFDKSKLLNAAAVVFAQKGMGATIQEISEKSEMPAIMIHRHFPTKEKILEEIFRSFFSEWLTFINNVKKLPFTDSDFFETADIFIDMITTLRSERAEKIALAVIKNFSFFAEKNQKEFPEILRKIDEMISKCQEKGIMRKDSDPESIRVVLISSFLALYGDMNSAGNECKTRKIESARKEMKYLLRSFRA